MTRGPGWSVPIYRQVGWVNYKPPPSRPQKRCPECGMNTGVFLAGCTHRTAMYHCCNHMSCSVIFEGERPEPMRAA